MPFVRISLKKGKSKAFKTALSNSVHQALVNAFNIPKDDIFQVIAEFDEENIIFPSSYMGIEHTSDIIFISIVAKGGRSADMKKSLYSLIAENVEKSTNHNKSDLIIVLNENTEEDWSFGDGIGQLIQ